MKKIVSIILIAAIALCFASCGKKDPATEDWHVTSGIKKWFAVYIDNERTNVGGEFTESGIRFYYNDRIEKVLFCEVTYDVPDANPDYTEDCLVVSDIDKDGTSELLFTFKEDGDIRTAMYRWSAEENTFKPFVADGE